jgi:CRISPR system Cascade subunit CasA
MDNFNLIDSPWIPVRWRTDAAGDTPALVSLDEAFRRGSEIADLDCAPHERIALTRLLVCITHAALGAPEDDESWDGFGDDLETAIPEYLHRSDVHLHFNLLGDGPRFLQTEVKLDETSEPVPSSKLCPELATNNNPTLLDHFGTLKTRNFSDAKVALALLTFQNFYPPFKTGQPQGPCSKNGPLHTLLLGGHLSETIVLNCLTEELISQYYPSMGKPVWESRGEERTRSLLDNLVPIHRKLWVKSSHEGFFHVTAGGGVKYPTFNDGFLIPTVTVIVNKKGERYLLRARKEKAIWRDLHTLLNLRMVTTESGFSSEAPLVLQAHEGKILSSKAQVWTGTLITNESKIEIDCESTFTLDKSIFEERGQRTYSSGINFSEKVALNLSDAVKAYWRTITAPDPKKAAPMKGKAEQHYWHALDREHRILIDLASHPKKREGQPEIGDASASDEWSTIVRNSAIAAYESTCPRTNPRQLQAFAAGLRKLKLHTSKSKK